MDWERDRWVGQNLMKGGRNEQCVGEKKKEIDKERQEDIHTDRQLNRKTEE